MESNPCIDRISDLPDSILGKILSYLPLEDVIVTSLLSTRWKPLFPTHVPLNELVLYDCHTPPRPEDNDDASFHNFVHFVDKLLNVTLIDVPSVDSIDILCEKECGDDMILSWARAALRLSVKRLHLASFVNDSKKIFNCLHGCAMLVELEIGHDFVLRLPEEFVLPYLKKLTLNSLILRSDKNSIHELIDGCPVLSELEIEGCDFAVLDHLYVRHPFITKVFIENPYNERCEIVVDSPKLESFSYEGLFLSDYVLKNVKSLHSVCINFDIFDEEPYGAVFRSKARRVAKLVEACSSATRLCLSGNSLKALYRSRVPLPTFQNLCCLVLGHMGSRGWKILAQLLINAPNLTTLIFKKKLEFIGAYEGFKSMLQSLPVCLELHVKKIEIWEFKWTLEEINLIEYFLSSGRVLGELIIYCLPSQNASGLKKLSMLPRHSKACQVLFKDKDNKGKSGYAHEHWFGLN